MPKAKLIQGTSVDQKMESIERILQHMQRRMHKKVTGIIPPVPLSVHVSVPDDGTVLKYLFPAAGKISRVCLIVNNLPEGKKVADFKVTIMSRGHEAVEKVTVANKLYVEQVDLAIAPGDRLHVTTKDDVSDIWFAALYEITPNEGTVITRMIEALEKELDNEGS